MSTLGGEPEPQVHVQGRADGYARQYIAGRNQTINIGQSPPPALETAADRLAEVVGAQWHAEEERRRVHDPLPLEVRWRLAPADLVDHWANIRCAAADENPGPLALNGHLEQIADVYRQIPSGRLAVLGRAGAGKTILAVRFLLSLIDARTPSARVPVIFSLSSWAPTTPLRSWLTLQLERDYPALAAPGPMGKSLAAALVDTDVILPVLDGFDEIAKELHPAALRALNATKMPMFLTSRPDEYAAAVAAVDVLTAGAVIQLEDLSLADLQAYLPRTTRLSVTEGRTSTVWDPVLARLRDRPADPETQTLRQVLSTPLMVALARTIYSDTPGKDPGKLLKFATPQAIEDHLVAAFLPAAYQQQHPGRPPGHRRQPQWNPEQAQRWLEYLAWHMNRLGTRELALWQLGESIPRLASGLVVGLTTAIWLGVAGWFAGGGSGSGSRYALDYALIYALMFGLAAGVSFGRGLRSPPSHTEIRFRGTADRFLGRCAIGFVLGGIFTFAAALDVPQALICGLVVGLAFGSQVWLHEPTSIASVPSPSAVLRQDRTAVLASWLAIAFALGTGGGLIVGYSGSLDSPVTPSETAIMAAVGLAIGARVGALRYGRWGGVCYGIASMCVGALAGGPANVSGLGIGVTFGVLFGLGIGSPVAFPSAWGGYTVSRLWLALRGHLPWRLMTFLSDAHDRGLLRQSGGVYQFSHERLQDHLAGSRNSRHPASGGGDRVTQPDVPAEEPARILSRPYRRLRPPPLLSGRAGLYMLTAGAAALAVTAALVHFPPFTGMPGAQTTDPRQLAVFTGHHDTVESVAFSPDGSILASGSDDHTIRLWDPATGKPLATLTGHTDHVNAVAISRDNKTLASGSDDGTVGLWSIPQRKLQTTLLLGHRGNVNTVTFNPAGTLLASGGDDGTVRLWNPVTGAPLGTLTEHASVHSVAFSHDGKTLAAGCADATVRFWNTDTGVPLAPPLTGFSHEVVRSVAFSPDDKIIATGSDDNDVQLWEAVHHTPSGPPLHGHRDNVSSVAFSPDGKTLASAGEDHTVRFWDPANGSPSGKPLTISASIWTLAFDTRDPLILATGSSDKTVRLWKIQ